MFGWELPPENSGGLGVACLGLAKAITRRGIDLTFVIPRKSKGNPFFKVLPANTKYHQIEVNSPLTPYLSPGTYKDIFFREEEENLYGENLFDEVYRYGKCARRIAKMLKFDVIHAHDWLSFGAGIAAKEVSGKPLIAHVHATEFDRGGGGINMEVYLKEKEGMEKADKIVAVSNFTKKIIVENYFIPPEKVEVVHNGMDDLESKSTKEEETLAEFKRMGYKIVLFTGRITIQKGPDYFISMARKVLDYMEKVVFVVAGSGDMEAQIMKQAADLGISDKVLFTGFLRGEKLHNLYRSADLFIMPSISEPFGLTPLEALINGTPVLISKQSGVSEVLTHALKTDFWDIEDMASKVLTSLTNPSLTDTLKEYGEREARKIGWDEPAKKCQEIYQNLKK